MSAPHKEKCSRLLDQIWKIDTSMQLLETWCPFLIENDGKGKQWIFDLKSKIRPQHLNHIFKKPAWPNLHWNPSDTHNSGRYSSSIFRQVICINGWTCIAAACWNFCLQMESPASSAGVSAGSLEKLSMQWSHHSAWKQVCLLYKPKHRGQEYHVQKTMQYTLVMPFKLWICLFSILLVYYIYVANASHT